MKHFNILFSLMLLMFAGVACAPSNLSYSEAQERNERKLETDNQREDAEFMVDAANFNLLLTNLSNKAISQGYARIVSDFARTAATDHQRMWDDLKELSKDKKIALPATMSEEYQQIANRLAASDKDDFDRDYLRAVETIHERTIRTFEEAALEANDSEIRAFAAAKLDMLRNHERKANELEDELL